MSEEKPPPPDGLVFSQTGQASRPEKCDFCFYADKPVGGAKPPQGATEETKKWYERTGYCRRANPGPTDKPNRRLHWQVVHLDNDWCGNGTV
jgi:hypothetical protein